MSSLRASPKPVVSTEVACCQERCLACHSLGHRPVQPEQLTAPLPVAVAEDVSVAVNADSRCGVLVCHHHAWSAETQLRELELVTVEQGTWDREWEDVSAFIKPCKDEPVLTCRAGVTVVPSKAAQMQQ